MDFRLQQFPAYAYNAKQEWMLLFPIKNLRDAKLNLCEI